MVLKAYTAEQIRRAERPHLEAGAPLMAIAAHGLVTAAARLLEERLGGVAGARILLLVGAGNNGGDALYAGAELSSRGAAITAVLTASRCHAEGLEALRRSGGSVLDLEEDGAQACRDAALGCALIVDGILGTGGSGGLREPAAGLVRGLLADREAAGAGRPAVLACDVPSGVDATTGRLAPPVLPADVTVTFAAPTTGLAAPVAGSAVGRLDVVPIGIEEDLPAPGVLVLEDADLPTVWPAPGEGDHKYTRGVLGTVAGSDAYPGAGLMCVRAAVNSGVGMVRYTGGDALAGLMALQCPEAVRSEHVGADRVQAWAVGSGAAGPGAEHEIRAALDSGLPVVADAEAIRILAGAAGEGERARASVIMTPHAGELASALEWAVRLSGPAGETLRSAVLEAGLAEEDLPEDGFPDRAGIEAAPLPWARAAREVLGGTLLLKGGTTVVAGPGVVYAHTGGSPWLATAGSGDTLTGMLGAAAACHGARVENGAVPDEDAAWAGVAAGALLLQRAVSRAEPGPLPPSVAAGRIPAALGRLLGA
jgi:hydroxyethylthiazole kinase-like uncharacterized protein yjeF